MPQGKVVRDETGQVWHVYEGDVAWKLWEERPWLPDDIIVPRRLISPDLGDSGDSVPSSPTLHTDAMNDKKMYDAVREAIYHRLDD